MRRNFVESYKLALYQLVEFEFLEKSKLEYFYYFSRFLSLVFVAYNCGDISKEEFLEEVQDAFNFMKERF